MRAFFAGLFAGLWDTLTRWLERKERDDLVEEGVQDDARIADQAAAAAVAKRAADAAAERVPPDKRKGRRAATAADKREG